MATTVEIYDQLTRAARYKNHDTRKMLQKRVVMSDSDKRQAVTLPEALSTAILIVEDYIDKTPRPPQDRNRNPRFDNARTQFDEWQKFDGVVMRLRELLYCIDPPPPHEYWSESLDIYVKEGD